MSVKLCNCINEFHDAGCDYADTSQDKRFRTIGESVDESACFN